MNTVVHIMVVLGETAALSIRNRRLIPEAKWVPIDSISLIPRAILACSPFIIGVRLRGQLALPLGYARWLFPPPAPSSQVSPISFKTRELVPARVIRGRSYRPAGHHPPASYSFFLRSRRPPPVRDEMPVRLLYTSGPLGGCPPVPAHRNGGNERIRLPYRVCFLWFLFR